MESNLPMRASIIVLCYNSLEETTLPCLESVVKNTPADKYELIVVDNASSDGTPEYLQEFARQHVNVQLQLNNVNKGYAGGNNDGIALANGEYIILLNNDTLVPVGWLEKLLHLFQNHPKIGLIGPVTNSAGNEQRIELDRLNEKNYEVISGEYIQRQSGVWFETEKLGFFCVAIRRSVVEKIGVLDEKFGIGMFEDDDYCVRAKKAGFTLAVAEDCFVFHKGSVSFGKLAVENYRQLFEKNRQYFYEKHHQAWTLTDIAFSYLECFEKNLRTYSHKNSDIDRAIERIMVRSKNLNHLLVQVHRSEIDAQKQSKNLDGSVISKRARWATRRFNFSRNVIHGTNKERLRYVRIICNGVLRRFGINFEIKEQHRILESMEELRLAANGKKVFFFPATVDYSYMRQRPQQLAQAISEVGYFVVYGTLNRQSDNVESIKRITNTFYLLNEEYSSFLSRAFNAEQIIFYCLWANNIKHLSSLPCSYVIYDYMDDLSLLDLPEQEIFENHQKALNKADLITVSASRLMHALPMNVINRALLVNNAVSKAFISEVENCNKVPKELSTLDGKIVLGYYGAIAEWMDFELLMKLEKAFPTTAIILIGPISSNVCSQVEHLLKMTANFFILDPMDQMDLVPYLKRFNICLIPFVKNDVTNSISPVKLFEYFAAGKPVVSVDIDECRKYAAVMVCSTHDEFIECIAQTIKKPLQDIELKQKAVALSNTWDARAQEIILRIQ